MIIYKTTNKITGKIYVGKHNKKNDNYIGSGKLLNLSIKKYGRKHFIREILEHCSEKDINDKEIYWIRKLDATNKDIGYNISKGGDGGNIAPWTEERKYKISKSKQGKYLGDKNPNYNHTWTEEQKQKLSKKNKNKPTWNKGLTIDDIRVKNNIQKRNKTMMDRGLYLSGKNHHWYGIKRCQELNGTFLKIDIDSLIYDFQMNKMTLKSLSTKYKVSIDAVRNRLKRNLKEEYSSLLKERGRR